MGDCIGRKCWKKRLPLKSFPSEGGLRLGPRREKEHGDFREKKGIWEKGNTKKKSTSGVAVLWIGLQSSGAFKTKA